MIKHYGLAAATAAFSIVLFAGILFLLDIGRISPVAGSKFVAQGQLCSDLDCYVKKPVALPYFKAPIFHSGIDRARFEFSLTLDQGPSGVQAIYLPRFNDDVSIRINGQLVRDNGGPKSLWNHPLLLSLPQGVLHSGANKIELELAGHLQEGLELQPFYIGPPSVLLTPFSWRNLTSIEFARFAWGFLGVLGVLFGTVWMLRLNDSIYMWLTMSCGSALLYLAHYAFDISFVPYKLWTIMWTMSIATFVLFVMNFNYRMLQLPLGRFAYLFAAYIGFVVAAAVLLPPGFTFVVMMGSQFATLLFALSVIAILWQHRDRISRMDFAVFFVCFCLAGALGLYDLLLFLLPAPPRNQHLFQFTPLVTSAASLWLIVSQLARTMTNFETLNRSLEQTIAEKSRELELSYNRLAEAEKSRAIGDERKRIMLDLHDGIGGQLANTLAYLENHQIKDEVLQTALENALRDLALMLDSLETEDSITTLLGMLRTRLEPLLSANGLEFDWRIEEEPNLPRPGPSQNLHLLRIVQEAITNVVKHANAQKVIVACDARTIQVMDDGRGFEANKPRSTGGGHGISNMRRRAQHIGAAFDLTSNDAGTILSLTWVAPVKSAILD